MLNLNQNVGAICNDGSVASYYVEQGDYTAGQTIMVYLEVSFQVMLGSERAKYAAHLRWPDQLGLS